MTATSCLTPAQRAELQLATARHLRWYPASFALQFDELVVSGWALPGWEDAGQLRFLVNGQDVADFKWPLPTEGLGTLFDALPDAAAAGFLAHHPAPGGRWPAREGYVRLNVTTQFGEHAQSYRTAWWVPPVEGELALPSEADIAAEVGPGGADLYRAGGATLAMRLDGCLRQRAGRGIADCGPVLEWGGGSGRMTRYLCRWAVPVTMVDGDAARIRSCASRLAGVRCVHADRFTDLPFDAGEFGLVLAPFIAHQLPAAAQQAWLRELARLLRPGGIALVGLWGQVVAQLHQDWGPRHRAAYRLGLYTPGENPSLDTAWPQTGQFEGTRQSHDQVWSAWSECFDVLDIVPALAHGFDVAVLRARGGPGA